LVETTKVSTIEMDDIVKNIVKETTVLKRPNRTQ
jgi:hypothetical protein